MEKRCSKQAASEVQHTLKASKRKRISKSNVMNIIKSRGIRSETELLALANECADDGLDDLKTFIADTDDDMSGRGGLRRREGYKNRRILTK